jgi:hypothetical protein
MENPMTTKDAPKTTRKTTTRKKAEPKQETVVEEVEAVETEEKNPTSLDLFIEHQRQALLAAGKAFESMIPEGVREHGSKAVEEMIEGYRVVFNSAIDEVLENVNKSRDGLGEFANRVEKAKIKTEEEEK